MGYYTTYDLTIIDKNYKDDYKVDHGKKISELAEYRDCFGNDIKWYDHDKNMLKYSLKYPELVFQLAGYGEEFDDIWEKYYKNGQYQVCQGRIIFDEYDESKLE